MPFEANQILYFCGRVLSNSETHAIQTFWVVFSVLLPSSPISRCFNSYILHIFHYRAFCQKQHSALLTFQLADMLTLFWLSWLLAYQFISLFVLTVSYKAKLWKTSYYFNCLRISKEMLNETQSKAVCKYNNSQVVIGQNMVRCSGITAVFLPPPLCSYGSLK